VSRLHAVIGIQIAKITITDLGSANGTWLNGVRVTPHTAHEIKHGDYVTLGTLKMKTIIRD
jgi:pSer/pThr/pTyr-binding forkhead associated (FHA) protein